MSNLSFVQHTGDGVTTTFLLAVNGDNIGYLRTEDIHVYVDGVEVDFTIQVASPHLAILNEAPADGAVVIIRRQMPQDATYSDFSRGNVFSQRNMNNSFLQDLYLTQELLDGFLPEGTYQKQDMDFGDEWAPTRLREPVNDSDAATKSYVDEVDARVTEIENTVVSGDTRFISYLYKNGSADGGELFLTLPYVFETINRVYINGFHQTKGLAWDYDSNTQIIELAEELHVGDEVVIEVGLNPERVIDNEVVSGNAEVIATGTTNPRSLSNRFGDVVRVSDFLGCNLSDPSNDDTAAMQAALDTGRDVYIGEGTLTLSDQVFTANPSQQIIGAGRLNNKDKLLVGVGTRVLVPLGTTIPKTQKTRRLPRSVVSDPDDSPLSCVFTLMGRGNVVRDLSIELECDYSDMSHTNLGADCDVAIFNNCNQDVEIHNVSILGYFRKAGIYLDVTASNNVPDRITGVVDTDRTTGSDRIKINHVEIDGSWKDIFLAGPILNGAGTYYDDVVGLVSETRGGSGASDLLIEGNNYLQGRNHHSGRRGYDPVMNPDVEDIDSMTGSIVIDSRRGSASQGRTRRIHIKDTRITSFEAARIFTGRAYEVYIEWLHTEPGSTSNTRFDTAGNIIDLSDTENVTYGPIACQSPIDPVSGTDQVYAWQVWGTGVVGAWTTSLVTNFYHTRRFVNPQFNVSFDNDVAAGGKVTAGTSLNGESLNLSTEDSAFSPILGFITDPTYTLQVGKYTEIAGMVFVDILLSWSGLDTADPSGFSVLGLPLNKDKQSGFLTKINVLASTGLVNPETLYFCDNGSDTQVSLYDGTTGALISYNSGRVLADGTLALTLQYRS